MKINFYKKYELFKVLFIILMLNKLQITKSQNEWCWTKSMINDPNYIFDKSKGGINWGFCEKPKNKPDLTAYDISIETSKLPKSETE